MKNTKRYLAFLVVDALAGYGSGRILRDAIDSGDTTAVVKATLITVGGFAATMYVSRKISEDMATELQEKYDEYIEKRRAKKESIEEDAE